MNRNLVKRAVLLFSLIPFFISAAVPAGTLVKTSKKLVPIEQLTMGDKVFGLSANNTKPFTDLTVQALHILCVDTVYVIKCAKGELRSSGEQLFFDPVQKQWIAAKDLTSKNFLLNTNLETLSCQSVSKEKTTETFYDLTLNEPHVFFVSELEVLTHNFIPIAIGIGLSFGGGEIALTGASLGIGALACGIFSKKSRKKRARAKVIQESSNKDKEIKNGGGGNNNQPSKNVDDILRNTVPGRQTSGKTTQYEKSGGFDDAVKDFESLNPSAVKEIPTGKVGKLPDGRVANVRANSSDRRPTLEIQNKNNSKIKIRYGDKPGD